MTSKTEHENAVLESLQGIETAVEAIGAAPGAGGWVETLIFPKLDLGAGTNVTWKVPAGYRAKILAITAFDFTEAIANSPTIQVGDAGDPNEQIAELTLADQAANTNDTTDRDAAVDLTRSLVDGVLPVAEAAHLFLWTGTDPGTGAGVGDVAITVRYFI